MEQQYIHNDRKSVEECDYPDCGNDYHLSVKMEQDFEKFRYRYVEDMPQKSPAYKQLMEDFINAVCSGTERPY